MAKIKLDVYENGAAAATVTMPLWLVTVASKLLPKLGGKQLQDHIDLDQIVKLAKDPQASGVILEIEDHKSNERVVISIVGDETKAVQE